MKAVFFSIEPTTYGPTYEHQIINITATHDIFKELAFNVYVKPTCRIMPSRTKQCGLKFVDGVMYLESIKVESVKARIAMKEFIAYLKTMNDSVLLVSYGDFYDARRLLMMAEATGLLGEFKELVKGIADMKTIYADKGHQGLSHITYYGANNFEDGCEHEETNTASKRVVIFQKLIQFGKESQLEFKDLWKSAKTVDNILEETLLIEENIAKNPDYDVPSGYYVRFKKEIEKLS